jgi:hypothetical protein
MMHYFELSASFIGGYFSFLTNVISSLAWPTAVVGGIYMLRKEIARLIPRIEELSAFGIKAKLRTQFEEGTKERAEQAKKIKKEVKSKVAAPLADGLPNADVIDAYERIQAKLEEIRSLIDGDLPTYRSIVERLEKDGYIKPEAAQLFNSLREAKNIAQAAGSAQLSPADASQYREQAGLLIAAFEDARKDLRDQTA